jgi:hypothetical protein
MTSIKAGQHWKAKGVKITVVKYDGQIVWYAQITVVKYDGQIVWYAQRGREKYHREWSSMEYTDFIYEFERDYE